MRQLRIFALLHDPCVTCPHVMLDGSKGRFLWRCELCGTESADSQFREGCWNCNSGVGWR